MTKFCIIFALSVLSFSACHKDPNPDVNFKETRINLNTHKLSAFSVIKNAKYLVVFETGLGDDHTIWDQQNLLSQTSGLSDILLYDRAGYGNSENGPAPRDIEKLTDELTHVIDSFSNGRKVILVGHSLGGMIIRDYAVKNPAKTAALLFVDPSHEFYNQPTQAIEDMIYDAFNSAYGANFGGTMEARSLIEDSAYLDNLPDLPNIPVIVLTSMKVDETHPVEDRQHWYAAHELLKTGLTDFTHISTTASGHYIMVDEPALVWNNLKILINKLP